MTQNLTKPVIGLSMGLTMEDHDPDIYPGYRFEFFKQQYYEILEELDSVILPLPNTQHMDHSDYYIGFIHALLLVGGEDVDPKMYGDQAGERMGPSYLRRDNFEREMIFKATTRNLPLLGICRGHQLINVALGGSLYQDLDEREEETMNHRQTPEKDFSNIHEIYLEENSRLRELAGDDTIVVNSAHHQIIRRVPEGLRVAGKSKDGVIEALEGTDQGYIQTVQWHPEVEPVSDFSWKIFENFVDQAVKYKTGA